MCFPKRSHMRNQTSVKKKKRKKKEPYLMAESRCSCRNSHLKGSSGMQQQPCSKVRLLPLSLSLSLFPLLNHCSKPRPLMFVPFNSQKVLRPGSQQTPLCSWKRQLLFSETLGPSLWLPPHLPFRSIMLSGREGCWWGDSAAVASREPMGAQDSFPVISPPSKQNPACLWHITELWKVMQSYIWNASCLFFSPH